MERWSACRPPVGGVCEPRSYLWRPPLVARGDFLRLLGGISRARGGASRLPPAARYIYRRKATAPHHQIDRSTRANTTHQTSSSRSSASFNMSDKCGNCDCADKSQCVKKGNSYGVVIVDAEKSHFEMVEEVAYENDGKCKCGTSCSCADCNCGK